MLRALLSLERGRTMVGTKVVLRTRMSAADAHYAGELVEGAHIVTAWGDVATELAIRMFGDEGLFVGYSEVRYTALERAFPEKAAKLFEIAESDAKKKYEQLVKRNEK